ncbi:IS1380 family transposase [Clostridium beijerinckii]|uniref:IS1380 family transposase n=1 Tax=Clostridium beijerinckii TaxID=1520 RepID=UPI0003D3752A|nr:IS1380 family transposase [Clostridium beijerinckii]AQS18359.2 IS1380 family transposase [Clostridium beijerinckii NRRL B-598]
MPKKQKNYGKNENPYELYITKTKTFDKIIKKLNINTKFNDSKVTSIGNYIYLELFKHIIGIKSIIEKQVSYNKASNSILTVAAIIDYLIDASILGFSRFLHTEDLRRDRGFLKIKEADRLPSEKVCRDFLKELPLETLVELRRINKQILDSKSKTEDIREVCINFDDTVVTIFGNQESGEVGYNPRYHGRHSFKEKVGIIAGTDELLDITLESGKHHSNYDFITFFKDYVKQLPQRYILKRVRLDRGFFDEANFLYFEEEGIEYVVKCKMNSSVKKIISYINENPKDYFWQPISSNLSVTEISLPLPSWQRARRLVIVREQIEQKNKEQIRIDECFYDYQVIVTNIDYLTGEEIFQDYNQRCDVENKIDDAGIIDT